MPVQVKQVQTRLRFKHDIPLSLEYKLQNKYGFHYFARSRNNWVEYEKYVTPPKRVKYDDLPAAVVNDLTRRVNRIADNFADPDEHKDLIKIRCTNLARTLEPKQRQWVLDWISRNIDDEEPGGDDEVEEHPELPWEDGPVPQFLDPRLNRRKKK